MSSTATTKMQEVQSIGPHHVCTDGISIQKRGDTLQLQLCTTLEKGGVRIVILHTQPTRLHKQSTRKLHRTWDSSTEVSPRPEYRRLYGRVRCGPLRWMRDPTLKRTLTLYPSPHAAARLDPPLYPRESVSKGKGKGRCSQGVSRSVGGWAGKDRKTA